LRGFVAGVLPAHAVPSAFVVLSELPVSPNGKLDRAALPDAADWIGPAREPATPTEPLLCVAFADVLGLSEVGPEAGFFESGGHSTRVIAWSDRVYDLTGVRLGVRQMFEHPTPAGLAAQIFTDILRALALGADGVLVGRPLLWALAAGSEAGAGVAGHARRRAAGGDAARGQLRLPKGTNRDALVAFAIRSNLVSPHA
jgi:hypothetical protein